MIELEVDIEKMNALIDTINNIEILLEVLIFIFAILFIYLFIRNMLSWR